MPSPMTRTDATPDEPTPKVKRVHEIAKEQGLTTPQALAMLKAAGVYVRAASSSVSVRDIYRAFSNGAKPPVMPKPSMADADAWEKRILKQYEGRPAVEVA